MSAQPTAAEAVVLALSPNEARELCMALDDAISQLRDQAADHRVAGGDVAEHLAAWRIRQADALAPILERLWQARGEVGC
jgi:hypothetical protein